MQRSSVHISQLLVGIVIGHSGGHLGRKNTLVVIAGCYALLARAFGGTTPLIGQLLLCGGSGPHSP
ncbi:hypothetical protein ACWEHA_03410 [Amycolatopsis nivea]